MLAPKEAPCSICTLYTIGYSNNKLVLAQCLPACLSLLQAGTPACLPLFFGIGVIDSRAFTTVNINTMLSKYTERNIHNEDKAGIHFIICFSTTFLHCATSASSAEKLRRSSLQFSSAQIWMAATRGAYLRLKGGRGPAVSNKESACQLT